LGARVPRALKGLALARDHHLLDVDRAEADDVDRAYDRLREADPVLGASDLVEEALLREEVPVRGVLREDDLGLRERVEQARPDLLGRPALVVEPGLELGRASGELGV